MNKPFRVHTGYTPSGRNKWRRFATLCEAIAFCEACFAKSGIILGIEDIRG